MSLKFGSLDDGVMRYLNRIDPLELKSALPG
jgi:hypothetical protein